MYLGLKTPQRLSLIKKNFFLRATIMLKVIYLNFQPISWHFQFFGHPVWSKQTQNNFVYIFGTKGSQKTPPHKGNIFWRATILIDVIYLTFCPFYGIFNFLGHPVCSKQTKNKFIYIFGTKGFQKNSISYRKTFSGEQIY